MKRLAITLLFASLSLPAGAETITGRAVVVDGDTLRIGIERIRLIGIDAPERGETCATATGGTWPCGAEAAGALAFYVEGGPVTCEWSRRDQYDRMLAVCGNETFPDFNTNMVLSGLAWAYLSDVYRGAEATARSAMLGVWQAPTQTAADYRRAHDATVLANQPLPPDPNCTIKGNISSSGERIFHEPGTPSYAETVIRVEHGERWFCTAGEAIGAGWRPPRG